jgi:hypothetical protein
MYPSLQWRPRFLWPGGLLLHLVNDTRALQAYLGHKNIQHTVRYTELAPDRFKLRPRNWQSPYRSYSIPVPAGLRRIAMDGVWE